MVGLPEAVDILSDAWDYKGRPAVRSRTGGWSGAAMILVVELNERLTTLGIAVNLVTYLTGTMHLGNAASANTVTNFMGTSFMLCLLGGFVADTFLGRYLTIAIFAAVQASGVSILTISTAVPGLRPPACADPASGGCVKASGAQLGVLYLALYLTALGTGGLKSSVSGFGSDQFDETDRGEKAQMMKFFNWFFFFISLGSLLAVTVLVYIQDNLGRQWGYGVCATAIALGLVVFLSGTRKYRFKKLVGSPLTQIAAVVAAAWRKRGLELPSDPSLLHDIDEKQAPADAEKGSKRSKAKQRVAHTKQFRHMKRNVEQWILGTSRKILAMDRRGFVSVGAYRRHAFGNRAPRAELAHEKAADTKKRLIVDGNPRVLRMLRRTHHERTKLVDFLE